MEITDAFDWTLMRSFLAVIEAGSLLGAARNLHSNQPTLGRHIALLEKQLGVALFERTGRGLNPTAAAAVVADHARTMREGADAVLRSVTRHRERTSGTVRLTASQPVACYLLPPLLARLQAEEPAIAIEVVASNKLSNLLRREADIAVRMVRPTQTSLIARRIARVGLCAAAHRDYLKQHGTPKRAEDLLNHRLIGYDQDDVIVRAFASAGQDISRDHFMLRSDDLIVQWQALRAAMGIGFVAHHMAAQDPQVQCLLPELAILPLPVWLTVHREIRSSRHIRIVFDFLATHIAEYLRENESFDER
jgi:DNA-binding transcriptional LysR family regulator